MYGKSNWLVISVLLAAFAVTAWAQIVSPSTKKARCGAAIPKEKVLVLDLEPFGDNTEEADAFIQKYVQNLDIRSEVPETVQTIMRSATKNRMSAMKRAQKEAAQRGCSVVLVLAAWAGNNSAAHAQPMPGGQSIAVGMHFAYAKILMASGDH